MINTIAGLRIFYSPMALKETTERLFPASRHRSKRIHKKQEAREATDGIVAHPSFAAALKAQISDRPPGVPPATPE